MSHERSDRIWHVYEQSAQKFDYFMAALCTTLTGYVAQHFRPAPIGWNAGSLELLAIFCLIVSVVAALKRLENVMVLLRTNHQVLYNGESAGELMRASQHAALQLNELGGELMSPEEVRASARRHRATAKAARRLAERVRNEATGSYRLRNGSLVLGFVLLVAARVIAAYPDTAAHEHMVPTAMETVPR